MEKVLAEKKVAQYFADWLRKVYGINYDVEIFPNDDSNGIDARLHSFEFPELKLQLKDIRWYLGGKALLRNGKLPYLRVSQENQPKFIRKRIDDAEKKYIAIKKGLTLIVYTEDGSLRNEQTLQRDLYDYVNSDFRGIYFIRLPAGTDGGQVIPIKELDLNEFF